jgi:hypothetical protein
VRAVGSTWIPFIGARSIIRPPSMAAFPATLYRRRGRRRRGSACAPA